jgi:hypothetical protein
VDDQETIFQDFANVLLPLVTWLSYAITDQLSDGSVIDLCESLTDKKGRVIVDRIPGLHVGQTLSADIYLRDADRLPYRMARAS